MTTQQVQCKQCSKGFQVSPEDQLFYERINVPRPTLCPDCRYQRRLLWRNERTLYSRACNGCNKSIIALYDADSPFIIYCYDCYYAGQTNGKWSGLDYGRDIDFSRPFFEQFKELQAVVPRVYALVVNNENSEYTNGSQGNKNCYLIFVSDHNEDSIYSYGIYNTRNSSDLLNCNNCELCYELVGCSDCYDVKYSVDSSNCTSSAFLLDCKGSQHCFMSYGLRNQEYVWRNEQLTKEEYEQRWNKLRFNSRNAIEKLKREFTDLKKKHTFKYYHGLNNEDFSGDYLERVSNSYACYESYEIQGCKYVTHGNKVKDCYDGYVNVDNSQLGYEMVGALEAYNVKFACAFYGGRDSLYADSCKNVKDVFGCIGLQNDQYCILNKQYSPEEYATLKARLIEHMKQTGEYGEFFPITIAPFAYNETAAQDMFPLSKVDIENNGWRWKEAAEKAVRYSQYRLPDSIETVKDDVLETFLTCNQCSKSYKLTSNELQFYRHQVIPIPEQCFNCRHGQRLAARNPRSLWKRRCMCTQAGHSHGSRQCPTEFETTYSSSNPALVYCEQCYNAEIY